MNKINNLFNWSWFNFFKCILGIFIFSISINLFLVPNNLYTGGILGVAQLIRSLIIAFFKVDVSFDISSIIYYIINIPLFVIAYKKISRFFFVRTVFCVSINTIFLAIIPIPRIPLLPELIANILIGGVLGGIGIGMTLSTGASTGGIDIIGIALNKKNRNFSVGNIGLGFNAGVYIICGIVYGIEIMIYSIIYAVFETILIDKTHHQNVCSQVIIFTKNNPKRLIEFLIKELERDATFWNAIGGYTNVKTYIIYVVLNKYERMRLEKYLKEFDENAFLVSDDGVNIKGKFEKNYV